MEFQSPMAVVVEAEAEDVMGEAVEEVLLIMQRVEEEGALV